MRPTFIVSLCLMQDDFTRQGDSTVPQWVNLNKKMQFAFSALKTRVATRDQKCKQIPRVRTSLNCSNIQQSIFDMVATKRCACGTSKNDSRYQQ
jgi:tRNA A37 threonylcarbamoyltransferase TsaD